MDIGRLKISSWIYCKMSADVNLILQIDLEDISGLVSEYEQNRRQFMALGREEYSIRRSVQKFNFIQ